MVKVLSRHLRVVVISIHLAAALVFAGAGEQTDQVAQTTADLIARTEEYKASLEALLRLYEGTVKNAAQMVEKRNELYTLGLVSKAEVEQSESALNEAQGKLDHTRRQISECHNLITEVKLAEEPAKAQYSNTANDAIIRHIGSAPWSLSGLVTVESFYARRFGASLPVTALGQTLVHSRMGFNHADAVDVAVHPDSLQGQELMAYLRGAGISFIAFRSSVPGSATGAHIHIGRPSAMTSIGFGIKGL